MTCTQGTLIASVVVGSIQWGSLGTAHWVVWACWYETLILSLVSVMLAFYLSLLLSNFAINPLGDKLLLKALHLSKNNMKARWASLFALQVPIMLLSYSLIAYILGMALLVACPLWNDPWGPMSLVSHARCLSLHNMISTSCLIFAIGRNCIRGLYDFLHSGFCFSVPFHIYPERRSPEDRLISMGRVWENVEGWDCGAGNALILEV
jgi:hypothetical protein